MKHLVVIPTYNEKENVEAIISAVSALPNMEILIVDDNSPDGTANIVEDLQNSGNNKLHLMKRSGKLGLGTAYIAGFKFGLEHGYDFISEMDADFSHNPADLLRLREACLNGADIAVGSRYVEGGGFENWPKNRIFISKGGSLYVRMILSLPVKDSTAGFVCYKSEVLRSINLDKIGFTGYAFQIEMKYVFWKLGYTIQEVPIVFKERELGQSKMNVDIIKEAVTGVLKLRLRNVKRFYQGNFRYLEERYTHLMKITRKLIRRVLIAIVLLTVIILSIIGFNILSQTFYTPDGELMKIFHPDSSGIQLEYADVKDIELRYAYYSRSEEDITLVMLHGAPGSCADFNEYLLNESLQSKINLLSIERPGYGKSVDDPNEFPIEEQAMIIELVMDQILSDSSKFIMFSHSYGGPVAALLAEMSGARCLGHIMIAPVLDPVSEKVFWYSSIPLMWPFKYFSSNSFKRAAKEKLGHKEELEELIPLWRRIKSPTIHIHGDKDWLASIDNVQFCESTFDSDYYRSIVIEEGSHFILWDQKIAALVEDEVEGLISAMKE